MFNPEQNFDFFNPYDGLSNNWFGKSVQECSFSENLKEIECLESHNFNSKLAENGDLDIPGEGKILIFTKLYRKSHGKGTISIKESSRPVESLKVKLS